MTILIVAVTPQILIEGLAEKFLGFIGCGQKKKKPKNWKLKNM